MCLSVFYKKLMDVHYKSEYFIWRDDHDAAGWVSFLLGVLPREVIGFHVSIPVPCSISCSVNS